MGQRKKPGYERGNSGHPGSGKPRRIRGTGEAPESRRFREYTTASLEQRDGQWVVSGKMYRRDPDGRWRLPGGFGAQFGIVLSAVAQPVLDFCSHDAFTRADR